MILEILSSNITAVKSNHENEWIQVTKRSSKRRQEVFV